MTLDIINSISSFEQWFNFTIFYGVAIIFCVFVVIPTGKYLEKRDFDLSIISFWVFVPWFVCTVFGIDFVFNFVFCLLNTINY